MLIKVVNRNTEEDVYEDDFQLFDDDCDVADIHKKLRRMWRTMCDYRDEHAENVYLNVSTVLDSDGMHAAALALNISEFTKTMAIYANAYLPKVEGIMAIRDIFDKGCFCWPKVDEEYTANGQMTPYGAKGKYIFSFNFYDFEEWKKYTMSTISNAARFVPYDVADYSEICKMVRKCPKNCRPMVWLNPIIAQAFMDAQGSEISMENFQTFVSSFIITASLDDDQEIDDRLISQLWEACRAFAENEDGDDLLELYANACDLIMAR